MAEPVSPVRPQHLTWTAHPRAPADLPPTFFLKLFFPAGLLTRAKTRQVPHSGTDTETGPPAPRNNLGPEEGLWGPDHLDLREPHPRLTVQMDHGARATAQSP